MFPRIKLLNQQTYILIAAFNWILTMNSGDIVYNIRHGYSNNLGQWYFYLISHCIVRIWSLRIPFSKLKIMELLIIELYLISNGMIMNNWVLHYGVSSNNTLILFGILLILIILIFDSRNYIQVCYKIIQWHLLLQFVRIILFRIPSTTFCKWKIMQLLIIELYLISNGMIMNIYGVSSNNILILFRILLIIFICKSMDYYYYIQVYYKISQWNLINIDIKCSLQNQRYLVGMVNYILQIELCCIKNGSTNWMIIIVLFVKIICYNLRLFYT